MHASTKKPRAKTACYILFQNKSTTSFGVMVAKVNMHAG